MVRINNLFYKCLVKRIRVARSKYNENPTPVGKGKAEKGQRRQTRETLGTRLQESLIPHDMFYTENALAILYMALILSNLTTVYSC